jgi:hypothetical protein
MELEHYAEIYLRRTAEYRPERFKGKKRKEQFKSWKSIVDKIYSVFPKDPTKPLTLLNSVLVKRTRKGPKIVVEKYKLDELWEKFHCSNVTGGHQGFYRICLTYCLVYLIKVEK